MKSLFSCMLIAGLMTGCAATHSTDANDPIEGLNRGIFKFNDAVDTAVIAPVAKGYRAAVPQPARTGVRNVIRNLQSPTIVANDLLQGNFKGAADDTTRFVANTLLGLGGLFDVAGHGGVNYRSEDFGQTLAVWGAGNGPYLVLPLFGPSSVRDTVGLAVDTYTDPLNRWMANTDRDGAYYTRIAVQSIDKREELLDVLSDLKKNSVDYYAAVRSAYVQKRATQVQDRVEKSQKFEDIP